MRLLIFALATAHIALSGARVGLVMLAFAAQLPATEVGTVVGLMMVVPAFIAVPVGRWVDGHGHRVPATSGLLLLFAGAMLVAVQPPLAALAASGMLIGSGFTLAFVSLNYAIGRRCPPSRRTEAFGLLSVGFSLASIAGPTLVGFAIDHCGFSVAFWLLALAPAASLGLLWCDGHLAAAQAPPPVARAARRSDRGVLALLRERALRPVLVASALMAMAWDLFTFLVPLHAARIGLSASTIGLIAGAFGLGNLVVRIAIPHLSRRLDDWSLLALAFGLAALGYGLLPLSSDAGWLLLIGFLLGVVLGAGNPVTISLVYSTAPADRSAEAGGLRYAITGVSQSSLPMASGALAAAWGAAPVFLATSAMLALGALVAAARRRR